MSRPPCALLLFASVLTLPGAALARAPEGRGGDACGPEVKDPQRLAAEGLRVYKDASGLRDAAEQVKAYERSLRCYQAAISQSEHSAAKVYHPLGLVYEKLGRYVEAVEAFRRFLREVPEHQRNPGVTKQISDKLEAMKAHVGELAIDTVPGLEVRLDERPVGRAPLGRLLVVTPGTHVVTVGDPAIGTLGAEVAVAAGKVRRVDLTAWKPREATSSQAEPAPVQPVAQAVLREDLVAAPAAARRARVKPWMWAVTGVAIGALIGTAVGLGVYYGTSVPRPDATLSGWR